MGSVEREHDSVTIDAGEVGPCWAVSASDLRSAAPRKGSRLWSTSATPWWTSRKWARKSHVTVRYLLNFVFFNLLIC